MEMETAPPPAPSQRRHTWPWFVIFFLMLGVVLAVLWMSAEVRRAKERRAFIIPSSGTNSSPATSP